MKAFLVGGARPNFMKIAPMHRACNGLFECRVVHTGQHYDSKMSDTFFRDLDLPGPHIRLHSGSGSDAYQTAKIMVAFEEACVKEKPDLVILVGDVNSTLACSIVSKKLQIRVAHVEAGLRSFDMTMPEEINRMVTDAISDYLFVTEESGRRNLLNEGKLADVIHFVGNVMIDNLLHEFRKLEAEDVEKFSVYRLKPPSGEYAFLTLHRPSNVDNWETFVNITSALNVIAEDMPIFFPVHPRTKKMADLFGVRFSGNIKLLPPLGFRESLYLWKDAAAVFTDSGGLQDETTALGIPCVTIRENTERPATVETGSNVIAGTRPEGILRAYRDSLEKSSAVPKFWDGRASERIWEILARDYQL